MCFYPFKFAYQTTIWPTFIKALCSFGECWSIKSHMLSFLIFFIKRCKILPKGGYSNVGDEWMWGAEQNKQTQKWSRCHPVKALNYSLPLQEETIIMGMINPSQLIEEPFSINNSSVLLIYDANDLYDLYAEILLFFLNSFERSRGELSLHCPRSLCLQFCTTVASIKVSTLYLNVKRSVLEYDLSIRDMQILSSSWDRSKITGSIITAEVLSFCYLNYVIKTEWLKLHFLLLLSLIIGSDECFFQTLIISVFLP